MSRVTDVLMRRDNLTLDEAQELEDEVRDEIYNLMTAGDFYGVEDVMASDLGLEMDYIMDILY